MNNNRLKTLVCPNELSKGNIIEKAIVALPFILFLIYAVCASCLPIAQSPDEYLRLKVPFFIVDNGYLPSGFEESIRHPTWGNSYGFTTYGASLFSVVFIKIASFFTAESAALTFAARLPSCIFGSLTIAFLLKASKLLKFNSISRLLAGACLGLLPQFVFLSSYHNADIFSACCACLVIYSWVRVIYQGWSPRTCAWLGASLGLLALSYYFAFILIPLSIVFFCFTAKWQGLGFKKSFTYAISIFLIAFAIAGWFYIRNFIIYDGDFFGLNAFSQSGEMYGLDEYKPSNYLSPKKAGYSFIDVLFSKLWLSTTFKSSISCLGYMKFFLPSWLYLLCLILIIVSLATSFKISFINRIKRNSVDKKDRELILLWVLFIITVVGVVLISAYRAWAVDYQAQGRYIIVAWLPVIFSFGISFNYFSGNVLKSSKSRIIFMLACFAILTVIIVFAIISFWPQGYAGIMAENTTP